MVGQALPAGVVIGLAVGLAAHCAWQATTGGLDATVAVEAGCAGVLVGILVRMVRGGGMHE